MFSIYTLDNVSNHSRRLARPPVLAAANLARAPMLARAFADTGPESRTSSLRTSTSFDVSCLLVVGQVQGRDFVRS
jgi:hypothetical protein